jgi:hypothetical protein
MIWRKSLNTFINDRITASGSQPANKMFHNALVQLVKNVGSN